MPRILPALALVVLTAPAFAQAAPPGSGTSDNAHSGMATKPHPASGAHANAMAGRTGAARIEACGQMANGFLDDLDNGDFKTAVSNLDEQMRAALTAAKLGEVWQSVGARFGEPESRGNPQTVMYRGAPVVNTPLHFAKGDLVSQLVCDKDGKIAGFHIRAVSPATAAPASSAN